jgi:hypothetical protein
VVVMPKSDDKDDSESAAASAGKFLWEDKASYDRQNNLGVYLDYKFQQRKLRE